MDKIKDTYNRPIISLRISITNRCNIQCFYCHHDGMLNSKEEITSDEIFQIAKVAKNLGVEKVRLSGGEPLVRSDIVDIVKKLNTLNFKDISITTNGIFLDKYAEDLVNVGLKRVNVSLDTLKPETYKCITKKDYLSEVKNGILKAVDVGIYPVKINMVVMKGINDNEIHDMFSFCKDNGLILQLIEILETDNCEDNNFNEKYHFDMTPLEKEFTDLASEVTVRKFMQDRKKYFIDGGEVEIVRPMDNTKFCENCTRLRITPEGKIKPCLLRNDNLVDLISHIRSGDSEKDLEEIFISAVNSREPYFIDD
ncbi:GTP 3',8-cyclase MoaA [Methanobrevibacter acididurans]|uniref:GTP 3',8-cyclase MoaA n=1 Tax=Methanobrevibacter acididurans TaxID=120963 RepID=UPI0038FD3115